ncbi:leucyl/phenylalanyl-tRNA--protein transferase [Acinetobacter qingfengensis]|uniref:Leucyl/phenylalanyl-tRNA--protein transferase n=1 Tax=Acinetobacter qingfengensis TaxID=1262585 RepID=A0A1E7RCL4_9GAMM|nr:leucyl/phenylalanyl-tRNA--protein transferase [Acinetobacter qingfengensis]KAA8735091.1 leucyl/phenylalanyl-tRNA--protein transferase [Acinetobacter qingfengensis]OEY96992.1 leucyl/phenylalanyl-tRNA--protein transferase [Acinetobacter qingfengensis]
MNFDSIYDFPDPEQVDPDGQGLICIGGDLTPATLLHAYSQGLFPWFNEDEPICWWCPEPRCIIEPQTFRPSKSLIRNMKKYNYQVRIDQAFAQVIQNCAAPRSYSQATWISSRIIESYIQLHQLGYAHSIEIWDEKELIGGLYGISLGQGFFGESMFNHRTDASKMAFYSLMLLCAQQNCPWVDCQLPNDHLMNLGATTTSRKSFLKSLQNVINKPNIDWKLYQNSVFSTYDIAIKNNLNG